MTKKLSNKQRKELEALAELPDEAIDFSDIPELTEDFFSNAIRNPFYKPTKQPVTIRLDSDIVAWFKAKTGKYQSNINMALRNTMLDNLANNTKENSSNLANQKIENLEIRAQLMQQLIKIIEDAFDTQTDAAIRLGVTESKISNLIHIEVQHFTIYSLINMINKTGYNVEFKMKLVA